MLPRSQQRWHSLGVHFEHYRVTESERRAREGVIAGVLAYLMWGFLPLYFLHVKSVPASEMLAHRIVWSVPFGALIIAFRGQWREVFAAIKIPKKIGWLSLAAMTIGVNWLVYIIAVQKAQIFQASLGYYINPLLYVLVGVVFFGERLYRGQLWAVALATIGVTILTISGGEFPVISLALAVSFTIYGVIRKQVDIGGMPGLFIETALLLPLALIWLGGLVSNGDSVFWGASTPMQSLIMLSGPLTVLPLLCFALSARRLSLSTIGFLQFMAPTIQFIVGWFSGEVLTLPRLICFGLIWTAVLIFCVDTVRRRRQE